MARAINRLSAAKVRQAKTDRPREYLADGGGLYLQVTASGAKSWIFRFRLHGRSREMGLGSVHDVDLAEARDLAREKRRLVKEGIDPILDREREREARRLADAATLTFREAATRFIAARRAGWRNPKHAKQWEATLAAYAHPKIGHTAVQRINTPAVLSVLQQTITEKDGTARPFWEARPETAGRVRGRIEAILDWAKASGYREGDNPARWEGHIENILPARSKIAKVEHHAALPFADLPAFLAALRGREAIAARALEWLVLTATRTSETLGARWDEIDVDAATWTIPAARMKAGKEHRVPLSKRALDILADLRREGDYLFPGAKPGKPLSNMALLILLRRMGRDDITPHGFRTTFADWCTERGGFPRELVETALAHAITGKVEKAYTRTDRFDRRRSMMQAWGTYCAQPPAEGTNILPLRAAKEFPAA